MSLVIITSVGLQGIKGDPGIGAANKYFFSYGDASPVNLGSFSGLINTVAIVIVAPFNGINPSLQIGDSVIPNRLMNTSQNVPGITAEWQANPCYVYATATATQILLTIDPGSGATQGNGYVIIEN